MAAKLKDQIIKFFARFKKKRPGIHSKKKSSALKTSKNYKKKYKGQGK
ncbi:MAG: hypothetical protein ACO25L_05895 [Candidatus Nanopelagicales bacterium]|jgi:predicted SnoaL-like aldol condensation-catalyzing enzyme